MTAFDTVFSGSAFPALLEEHGETVIYRPAAGLHREITALVQREEIQSLDPVEGLSSPVLIVECLSDPTDEDYGGIDPDKVDDGGDKIELPHRKDVAAKLRSVAEVLPTDGGVTRVRLR
jgi:hypothetical protein